MWLNIPQTLHVLKSSLNLKLNGITEYDGTAEDICEQIVTDCWNGRFFQTSTTHFPQFWTRDFGWCTASLLQLGYKKEVEKTLLYALNLFSTYGKVTTTISLRHKPFDFPTYAVDSLPWLTHSIALINDRRIVEQFSAFLEQEINKFFALVVDQETGLVKPKHFSSMKDFAVRKSSCYDNCMLGLLSRNLDALRLPNPLAEFNYKKIIKETFWNGTFFEDDMAKQHYVAADANIFPFHLNIINNQNMLRSALEQIQLNGLDHPFPVKYTSKTAPVRFIWQELFMRNYERNTIWTHMGPLYIALLKKVNKDQAKRHIQTYTKTIETYKNYLEVFAPDGKPFTTPFYHSDQGMLWAANYLTL